MINKAIQTNRILFLMLLNYQWWFNAQLHNHVTVNQVISVPMFSGLRLLLVPNLCWHWQHTDSWLVCFVCPLLSLRSCQMGFARGILGRGNNTLSYWLMETVCSQSCTTAGSRWKKWQSKRRRRSRPESTHSNQCCCPFVWMWASLCHH